MRSQCPRDLGVICGKALEKSPGQRYQTTAEFAADLRRYLANEPIAARPPGPGARAWKWVQRNPSRAAAVFIAAVSFVTIGALALRTARESSVVRSQATRLEASLKLSEGFRLLADSRLSRSEDASVALVLANEARRMLGPGPGLRT